MMVCKKRVWELIIIIELNFHALLIQQYQIEIWCNTIKCIESNDN